MHTWRAHAGRSALSPGGGSDSVRATSRSHPDEDSGLHYRTTPDPDARVAVASSLQMKGSESPPLAIREPTSPLRGVWRDRGAATARDQASYLYRRKNARSKKSSKFSPQTRSSPPS